MITLNRLAERCREVALSRRIITKDSSHKGLARSISKMWRMLWNAPDNKMSENIPQWTYREEKAADIIIEAVTYLQSVGCKDIERLIKDKVYFNENSEDSRSGKD